MDDTLFGDALEDALPKFQPGDENSLVSDKQARWEHRIVGKLLTYYGLKAQSNEITRLCYDKTKQRRLTFEAFKMLNPTFPMWLGFNKKHGLHAGKMVELLQLPSGPKKRSKSWIYQMFEDAELVAPEQYQLAESNFGMVFELMYAEVGSELIAYRYNGVLPSPKERTTILQWWVPHAGQKIEMSSLDMFLSRLPWYPPG